MRVVFMGTPSYATTILEALFKDTDIEVVLVVTQEDKPVGRKQVLTPPHIKAWLLEQDLHVEIFQPKSLRSEEAQLKIASYQPDFIVVAAYGQILPKVVLDIAPCINLHASLLPKYRGASPIQSTLLANETYAGVTSMLMEEGLDTGAMLGFLYLKIEPEHNASILFETLANLAAELTRVTLKNFTSLSPLTQMSANATHCKKIKKEDGLISFEQSAKSILTRYKALSPWPGLFIESGLKLLELELFNHEDEAVFGVIKEIKSEGVVITCKQGCILLKTLQPISKNAMNALDYIRGKRLNIGDTLV
ncbi:methionyl-tRNA formyltransferase [Sulfurospirillum arsenophilum]|uniref:methionyl-tRNA formyltransferase n=1 Tax=Sulfurospirillum arsenophilum TaxID=56698 RepID=UPI0005A5F321|nr:methionyl-tRNA formyltransferase [Sulfurospirillum arsenophilum]